MTCPQTTLDDHEELPYGDSGYLRIPLRLAERYLTEDTENKKADVQAIGTHIQILVKSDRKDMLVRMPTNEWVASKVYSRSLSGWTINLKRWKDEIETNNGIIKVEIHALEDF